MLPMYCTVSTWVRVPELLFVINVLIIYTNLKGLSSEICAAKSGINR
jgi:hypothetical protein